MPATAAAPTVSSEVADDGPVASEAASPPPTGPTHEREVAAPGPASELGVGQTFFVDVQNNNAGVYLGA